MFYATLELVYGRHGWRDGGGGDGDVTATAGGIGAERRHGSDKEDCGIFIRDGSYRRSISEVPRLLTSTD